MILLGFCHRANLTLEARIEADVRLTEITAIFYAGARIEGGLRLSAITFANCGRAP